MWPFTKKAVAPTPVVVEEYRISEVEKEGFRKLNITFEDAKGTHYLFEFHPNYAHAFSDDLVKHAARSLGPKE